MAFSVVPTYVTNQLITSAHANTYWRDNLNALFPHTAIGDIAYADTISSLAALAIGGAGALLRSTGTSPAWLSIGSIGQVLRVKSASEIEWGAGGIVAFPFSSTSEKTRTSSGGVSDISGTTVDATVLVTSSILLLATFSSAQIGTSQYTMSVYPVIDGTTCGRVDNTGIGTNDKYKPGAVLGVKANVAAGTRTCKLQWVTGGDTAYIKQIYGVALVIPE